MIFGFLTLFIALSIAGVAGWFSIVGLMAIFSAAALPIAIMAGTLEVGKLIAASWLYRYWHDTSWWMKTYLTTAVVVLMLITSMGIFGYLSKAHLDQAAVGGNNELQQQQIQLRIDREQRKINDANTVIAQLDQAVQTLIDYDRIRGPQGSIAVRESQSGEREQLNNVIDTATDKIAEYQDQLLPLQQEQMQVELKVGPLKYVAELIYGESGESVLDKAVRLFILMLVFVFDPLAIIMVIAANQTLLRYGINLEKSEPDLDPEPEPEPDPDPDPEPEKIDWDHAPYPDAPSAVDDAATAMMESAAKDKQIAKLQRQLKKKPKEIEVVKEVEKIVEVPVEVEKIIEKERIVEKPVEVERIVEVEKLVTDDEKISELATEVERLIKELDAEKNRNQGKTTPAHMAKILANSELNKEDLSEQEILELLEKSSEEDVKRKMGFWAVPLPRDDNDSQVNQSKKYIQKK